MVRIPTSGHLDRQVARWWAWAARKTDLDIDFFYHTEGVDRTRNEVVRRFLASKAEVLWMIDDDVAPPMNVERVNRFLSHDYPLVSGVYDRFDGFVATPQVYKKEPESDSYRVVPRSEWMPDGRVFKTDVVGAGCLKIRRDLLEKMADPWFDFHYFERRGKRITRGEDFVFCEKAGGVVVDPKMECSHYREVDLAAVRKICEQNQQLLAQVQE
jgi:hypothetical protein